MPQNYTYVGEVHSASSKNINSNYYIYAIDKTSNKEIRVKNGNTTISGISFTNFKIGTVLKGSEWIINSLGNNVYYSEKETSNEKDLKLLSTYKWSFWNMRKVYLYIKQ